VRPQLSHSRKSSRATRRHAFQGLSLDHAWPGRDKLNGRPGGVCGTANLPCTKTAVRGANMLLNNSDQSGAHFVAAESLSSTMSSQRGNSSKNRKPAHQNKFAFVANKHDSKAMAIVEMPLGGVCAHCLDVLEWRKRMNRFKPIKNIGKCQICQERNITQVTEPI
jgi:hypothetical protein